MNHRDHERLANLTDRELLDELTRRPSVDGIDTDGVGADSPWLDVAIVSFVVVSTVLAGYYFGGKAALYLVGAAFGIIVSTVLLVVVLVRIAKQSHKGL